jgi:hypothetical protein
LRPSAATAVALKNYKASASGRSRILVDAAALALRLGLAHALPGKLDVDAGPDSIDAELSRVLGYDVLVALYVGPRRAVEKPVLQVISQDHSRTVGFAKLSTNDLTRDLIRTETDALRRLAELDTGPLEVPALLHEGTWRDRQLIVQQAVTRRSLRPPSTELVAAALGVVADSQVRSRSPWLTSPFRRRLLGRIEALTGSSHRPLLRSAIDLLDRERSLMELELGGGHGDWAPWNMTARSGRLVVWDWEHWAPEVPVGFDAIHHDLSRLAVGGVAPLAAVDQLLDGRDTAVTDRVVSDDRAALVTAYLTEIATRYVEDGEDVLAALPFGRLGEWLAPALSRCERALEDTPGP